MSKTYSIKAAGGEVIALVNAGSKSAALRHVAEKYFVADLASATDAIAATKAGVEIEFAGVKVVPAAAAQQADDNAQATGDAAVG